MTRAEFKTLREELGLSARQLSIFLGYPEGRVGLLERGRGVLRRADIYALHYLKEHPEEVKKLKEWYASSRKTRYEPSPSRNEAGRF